MLDRFFIILMVTNDRHAQHMACWHTSVLRYRSAGGPSASEGPTPTCRSPILDMFQVAITLVYRYQPPARAPIDAGELVADNGKIGDYRYQIFCLFWGFAERRMRSRVVSYAKHDARTGTPSFSQRARRK